MLAVASAAVVAWVTAPIWRGERLAEIVRVWKVSNRLYRSAIDLLITISAALAVAFLIEIVASSTRHFAESIRPRQVFWRLLAAAVLVILLMQLHTALMWMYAPQRIYAQIWNVLPYHPATNDARDDVVPCLASLILLGLTFGMLPPKRRLRRVSARRGWFTLIVIALAALALVAAHMVIPHLIAIAIEGVDNKQPLRFQTVQPLGLPQRIDHATSAALVGFVLWLSAAGWLIQDLRCTDEPRRRCAFGRAFRGAILLALAGVAWWLQGPVLESIQPTFARGTKAAVDPNLLAFVALAFGVFAAGAAARALVDPTITNTEPAFRIPKFARAAFQLGLLVVAIVLVLIAVHFAIPAIPNLNASIPDSFRETILDPFRSEVGSWFALVPAGAARVLEMFAYGDTPWMPWVALPSLVWTHAFRLFRPARTGPVPFDYACANAPARFIGYSLAIWLVLISAFPVLGVAGLVVYNRALNPLG